MFIVGDKVVYPMHGAGEIKKIEEKNILGEIRKYYILKLLNTDVEVMVPVGSDSIVGMRRVVKREIIDDVVVFLREESKDVADSWNKRYRDNMEKLKTGNILDVAEVVRTLTRSGRIKTLSSGERKLLNSARKILASEFALALMIDPVEAENLIEKSV